MPVGCGRVAIADVLYPVAAATHLFVQVNKVANPAAAAAAAAAGMWERQQVQQVSALLAAANRHWTSSVPATVT
jgi:hypothetical protein